MNLTEKLIQDIEQRSAAINLPIKTVLTDAGIDWSTWWRWKQGKSSPTIASFNKLQRALEAREKQGRVAA